SMASHPNIPDLVVRNKAYGASVCEIRIDKPDIQRKGTRFFNRLLTLIYAYPARRIPEIKS
ncbi:MAG: hypothetical protein ACPGES_12490, partial [Coraliomargarita sp.]